MPVVSGIKAILGVYDDPAFTWGNPADFETPVIVTYSFSKGSDLNEFGSFYPASASYHTFNNAQKANFRDAADEISDAAGIVFVEIEGEAMINVARGANTGVGGFANYPYTSEFYSAPFFNELVIDGSGNFNEGSYEFLTLLHELGHAVGLSHPHEGTYTLTNSKDNLSNTVMTYNNSGSSPSKLGPLDINALKFLYGDAINTNGWKFKQLDAAFKIEGSGRKDTIFGVADENRIYGEGNNDTLLGRDFEDRLYGGTGSDTLSGHSGDDLLKGGKGGDVARGGYGSDDMYGGDGEDLIIGATGIDTGYGGASSDELRGGSSGDSLFGGKGIDTVSGQDGWDYLRGGDGADMVYGGAGYDELHGSAGKDQLFGGSGSDTLYGGAGDDELRGGSGSDNLSGGTGDDTLTGEDGNDILYGGGGADRLKGLGDKYGGKGHDTITLNGDEIAVDGDGDDLIVVKGTGNTVTLGIGTDTIELRKNAEATINGFNVARDMFDMTSLNVSFGDFDFDEQASYTDVSVNSEFSIRLMGLGTSEITADLFEF